MSKWDEAAITALEAHTDKDVEVTLDEVAKIAVDIGRSDRSVSAKLRALGYTVEKKNAGVPKWSDELAGILESMVNANNTDVEIAHRLGKTVNQVRGKALSMGIMTKLNIVKQEKTVEPPKFNEAETMIVRELAEKGDFIEVIAEAVGKTVPQVRGKLLSLGLSAPQRDHVASAKSKIYTDEVVAQVKSMHSEGKTAAEIAEITGLKIIGLKSWLGKNKLQTSDMKVKTPAYTEDDIALMDTMISSGSSAEDVAAALSKTVQSIRITAGKNKFKFRD